MLYKISHWIWICFLLAACSSSAPAQQPTVLIPAALSTSDLLFHSDGGGEPRSPDYWLLWNSCAEGNQAEMARLNGGRDAGWILVDDLLEDPGVLVGELSVGSCQQAVNLLQKRDLQGMQHPSDPAYALVAQLLAAQLNLATGSESCPAVDQAVKAGQLLLISLGFDGSAGYLGPPQANQDVQTAQTLTEQLASYNTGDLCR